MPYTSVSLPRVVAQWVTRSLAERLPWWLAAAAVAGLVLPGPGRSLREATPLILAAMIGGLGLSLTLRQLTAALRDWRLLSIALVAQLTVTPLLALSVWHLGDAGPASQGLVVQAVAPSEVTSPLMAHLAGGSLPGAISILGVSILLAPLTMPTLLEAILGRAVPVPTTEMLTTLALTVALPLVVGSTIHTLASRGRGRLTRGGTALSAGMVALLVYAVTAGAQTQLTARPAQVLIPGLAAAVALLTVGLATGWVAGRITRRSPDQRLSLLFTTGMREFGVATAVALTFFDPTTALLPAIYGVLMMITTAQLARRLARSGPTR